MIALKQIRRAKEIMKYITVVHNHCIQTQSGWDRLMPSVHGKSVVLTPTRKSQVIYKIITFRELFRELRLQTLKSGDIQTFSRRDRIKALAYLWQNVGGRWDSHTSEQAINFNIIKGGVWARMSVKNTQDLQTQRVFAPTYSFISKVLCWVYFGKIGDRAGDQRKSLSVPQEGERQQLILWERHKAVPFSKEKIPLFLRRTANSFALQSTGGN